MKITNAEVFVGGPGKNLVTLKIMTDEGIYRGAYFRRGPVAMAAFGAIDMALWDIKAKGYKAVRVQCGIPDMPSASYGVSETRGTVDNYITSFSGSVPKEEIWDSEKYMRYMPK